MKTHAADIDYADMGCLPGDNDPGPEPNDILYAITRADVDKAAAELLTYFEDGEATQATQAALSRTLYRLIETTVEGILKNPGKQIMEADDTPLSKLFWAEWIKEPAKRSVLNPPTADVDDQSTINYHDDAPEWVHGVRADY